MASQQREQLRSQQQFAQQNAARDAQASQFEGAINNPANDPYDPSLQPTAGDTADVAAQKQSEVAKRTALRTQLFQQHSALFQPHEAPTLFARLGALATGKQKGAKAAPAPAPNTPPTPAPTSSGPMVSAGAADTNGPQAPAGAAPAPPTDALGIPISDPDVAAAHALPMHPMATAHPILDRFKEGLNALGQHLNAAAHPVAPPVDNSALLASAYTSPETIKREDVQTAAQNAQNLWGERGANALQVARLRLQGLRGQAQAPISIQSAIAMRDQGVLDPSTFINNDTGQQYDLDAIARANPNAQMVEYRQGRIPMGFALSDQHGSPITVGNETYLRGGLASAGGPNLTAVGEKAAPTDSRSVDQYGNVTTSHRATETPGASVSTAPVSRNAPQPIGATGSTPPVSGTPPLAAVNAGIAASNATSSKLNKGKPSAPISRNAPQTAPNSPLTLDDSGHIPETANVNPQVREFANQLIDDRDVDKIPAKAKADAAALARQYGWEQGKFTPREQMQMRTATSFLNQLQSSPALSVLDSFVSREKIASAMNPHGGMISNIAAMNLTAPEAQFVREYNAAMGTVQGLSSITRAGRPTEAAVQRLKAELPNVLQSANSTDAKARIDQLLKEVNISNQTTMGSKGPVKAGTPKIPGGSTPPTGATMKVPGNDGKLHWSDGKVDLGVAE